MFLSVDFVKYYAHWKKHKDPFNGGQYISLKKAKVLDSGLSQGLIPP